MDIKKICNYLNNNYKEVLEYSFYGDIWDTIVMIKFTGDYIVDKEFGDDFIIKVPVEIITSEDDGESLDEIEYYDTELFICNNAGRLFISLTRYPNDQGEIISADMFDTNDYTGVTIWEFHKKPLDYLFKKIGE